MELAERKATLRGTMTARRAGIAREVAARAGEAIAVRLAGAAELARGRRLALYAAAHGEPPLDALAAWAAERGIETLWPRIAGAALEFAPCAAGALVRGRFGILAPPDERPAVALAVGDVVLLPALALDAAGRRLGRGGGHYDRTLAAVAGPLLVGVGYDWQLVGEVPAGPEDRRVDMVATEARLLRTHAPRGPARVSARVPRRARRGAACCTSPPPGAAARGAPGDARTASPTAASIRPRDSLTIGNLVPIMLLDALAARRARADRADGRRHRADRRSVGQGRRAARCSTRERDRGERRRPAPHLRALSRLRSEAPERARGS